MDEMTHLTKIYKNQARLKKNYQAETSGGYKYKHKTAALDPNLFYRQLVHHCFLGFVEIWLAMVSNGKW